MAEDWDVSYKDLLVLSPQNDPFYVGGKASKIMGEWFADLWERAGYSTGVHLRRAHYWVISQGDIDMPNNMPYENTKLCWAYICKAAKHARYLGLVDLEAVIDRKHPTPHLNADHYLNPDFWIDVPEVKSPSVFAEGYGTTSTQPYHLEVWCEKSTMDDVLKPVCSRYGANYATFAGEVSTSACRDLALRCLESGKPARIFYISDFDPAGLSMPIAAARKLEWMLMHYEVDLDVRLSPIVLTADQVNDYQLPRTPIKSDELRGHSFEENHGAGAVELDALEALHPGVLASIVEGHLKEHYDYTAREDRRVARMAIKNAVEVQVEEITGRYATQIEALTDMIEELRTITVDTTHATYNPEVSTMKAVTDSTSWLFESERPYYDQVLEYKGFQGKD